MTARGEIWLARLDKVRPVIILTRDPVAHFLDALIVAPVTTRARDIASEVKVDSRDGVERPSVANLDNMQLVPRSAFLRRIGHARPETMAKVCTALHVTLGCA